MIVLAASRMYAQNVLNGGPELSAPSVDEKWRFFVQETFSPLTVIATAATAGFAQATNSDPKYGVGTVALLKRFSAAGVDNVTQNFFSDFVMASALHEDTRYYRRGPSHGFWSRMGYAISRGFVTQTDAGRRTVNWSNFIGTALSVGLSNAYYPAPSRTAGATAINWAGSAGGVGFGNLFPEFVPDFHAWLKRHHL